MTIFTKPATKIQQGKKTLLMTSFTVSDFQTENPVFYRINKLDPEDKSQKGYQRLLQHERANRLAKYAVDAWKSNQHSAFLPTSIFLATEKDISFDEKQNKITFDANDVCPFDVVDGQHRVEGLLRAAEKVPELGQFPIAVNIAVNSSHIEQMLHFYIVNMTQRAVDPAVGQRIRARFFEMLKTKDLPYIPSWIRSQIESGTDYDAIAVIDFLNSEKDSPWYSRITLSNQVRQPQHAITQRSFVMALKKSIVKDGHPLLHVGDKDEGNRVFKNYWIAVKNIFTDENHPDTVVFKSMGALFFSRISSAVIGAANSTNRQYKVEDFVKIFESAKDYLPEELLAMMNPEWWSSGNEASGMNSSAVDKKSTEFSHAINSATRKKVSEGR